MKFTKQQACENIVAKLTPNGETLSLSERSINDQLETLIPLLANEETELEAFITSCFPVFKTANANVNNDVSSGINKYKAEHPEPTPAPAPTIQQQPTGSPEMEQRMAELERRLAEQDKATKISSLKSQLKDSLKSKGVKSEKWIDTMLGQVSIDENCDVAKKTESLVGLYNEFVASVDPSTVPLGNPGGGGGNKNSIKNAVAAAAELAKSSLL